MAEISAIEELLLEFQQESGLAVCFVVNCSNDMKNHWELIRLAMREIIDRLVGENTVMSLVLVGNRVEVAHELTNDIKSLNMKISSLPLMGGVLPDIRQGLTRCHNLFEIYEAPVRRVAIVITNKGEGLDVITQMKNDSISVISIAMGPDVNQQQVAALATNVGYSFGLPSLPALRLSFQRPASSLPAPVLEITRARDTTATVNARFNNEGVSLVTLQKLDGTQWTNVEEKLIPSPKDALCFFDLENLTPKTTYTYRAIVKLASGHTIVSLPQTVKTVGGNAMTKLLKDKARLQQSLKTLMDEIINYTNTFKHPVRIGLVGKVGSGKSAAANSFFSVFKTIFQYVSIVGLLGENSLTTEPKPIQLPSTNLVLTDFFGWDEKNRYINDLKHLIQGLAPDNLKDGDTSNASYSAEKYTANAEQRKFYGVFLVVSPADVSQVTTLETLQSLCDVINRQGLQPVILLTKVDEIDPELSEKPELVYASEKVENYIKQLTAKRFTRGLIFPIISYFEPPFANKLDDVKNYLLLSALHTLLFNNMQPKIDGEGLIRPKVEQPAPISTSQLSQASTQLQDGIQSISDSLKSVNFDGNRPPESSVANIQAQQASNNDRCVLLVRQAGIDDAFRRCRLPTRTFEALKVVIRAQFNLACTPLHIYEFQPNGDKALKVTIDNDDDVHDIPNNATLEFTA